MKKAKMLGSLLTFAALVASGITFSVKSKTSSSENEIPFEDQYCVLASTHSPYTYPSSPAPTTEPKYTNTSRFTRNNITYDLSQSGIMYSRMNVASTWSSYRGESVKVAVIDTGCYSSHEDFSGTTISNLSGTFSSTGTFTSSVFTDNDSNSHGTASAATIAASVNNKGGTGIAPNVELVILKCESFTAAAIKKALEYCITNSIDVVNMSIQGYASSFSYSYTEDFGESQVSGSSSASFTKSTLQSTIDDCYEAGITVVAAAGNYNTTQESFPAANDHVISVASTGLTEANKSSKAGYSNYGSWVDVCAPGYVISPSKSSTSSYQLIMGTSFSAPLVTGAIALYKSKYPDATPDQIEKALKFTATDLSWSGSGAGAIDVGAFLAQAPDYKYVESVSLSESTKTLKVGDTYTLNPTITPSDATNKNIVYQSSTPSVCSVDENGVVTANSVGSSIYIYATSAEDSSIYDYVAITVEAAADTPQTASFTLSNGTTSGSGDSLEITWTIANVLQIKQQKSNGSTAPNTSYISAPRWYQNNLITFTPIGKTITKVEITCSSNSYASVLSNSSTIWSAGSASTSSTMATWTGQQSSAFTVKPYAQVRISSISVTYIEGSSGVTNYTVTFNSHGGSGTMANQTTTGSTYTTPSCGFNRSGYTCNNWALNGTDGTQYAVGETISNISSNITLYAIWTEDSGSTFSDDYGNYYDGIGSQLAGSVLTNALHSLNTTKKTRSFSYDGLRDKFQLADLDWTSTTKMVGFYDNAELNKAWDSGTTWNREHVWPKSRGGNSVEGDLHMVRPTSKSINSDRGNDFYGLSSGTYDPGQYEASYRGVAARIIFYSVIANTSLSLVDLNDDSESNNTMGKLSTLLQWNLDYQPSNLSTAAKSLRVEQYRNKAIYSNSTLQGNRNPFIDHPEYACKIWGATNSTTKQICGITGSLSVSQSTKSLAADSTFTLTATASGGSGSVYWDSSDTSVCTISTTSGNSVVVTGVSAGTATITAMYGSLTATCTVTVTGSSSTPSIESVSVSPKTMTLNISSGSASGTITPNVVASGGAATTVNWSVSPENQGVTVSNGIVTAASNATTGTYTVTATSTADNTKSDDCTVTVISSGSQETDIETITFSEKSLTDQSVVSTVNGTDCSVTFDKGSGSNDPKYYANGTSVRAYSGNTFTVSSSNKTIIKIELTFGSNDGSNTITTDKVTYSNGTWTGSASSVTFTVGGTNGNRRISSIKITYENSGGSQEPKVNSITIQSTLSLDLNGNAIYTFSPTIDADEGADTTVTWESSNTSVAQITSGGQVTALSTGQTTITATCGGKTAQCTVTVVDTTPISVTGVSLNKSTTSLTVGSTETLTATITPSNATNKNVTWSSSSTTVATVSNGTVTAVAIGTTTITVTTVDGGYTDTCTVTVTAAPTVTYQLEADSSEVPFNSGTNHIASVGVKLYQYNNGVKGSVVSSGSVSVDTSSLGRKTVQYTYSSTTYTTTVKVTNHGADIGETIAPHEETTTEDASVSHTFTAANTTGMPTGWSGSFSGSTSYESARGVQLLKSASCTITTPSYTNIKSITVYLARSGSGKGSFTFKIGNSSVKTVTSFNTTSTAVTYDASSNPTNPTTGAVQISGTASASSLYIKSITINYQTTTSQTIPGESHDATKLEQARAWATYFISETRTAETCLAELDSEKLVGLQHKWADLAYEYTEMIGDSKDEFCTSSDATIVEARNHYLYIISKFGASNLGTDGAFVKNSQNQVLSAKANNPLVFLKGNSSIPIIVIMSVISVTSIGLYFYLRKRKEE